MKKNTRKVGQEIRGYRRDSTGKEENPWLAGFVLAIAFGFIYSMIVIFV